MTANDAQIELNLIKAAIECELLIQTFLDRLKEHQPCESSLEELGNPLDG